MNENDSCPCGTGNLYIECCKPFHEGRACSSAEQVMRSRYSAYVLQLSDYIITTTHRKNDSYDTDFSRWEKSILSFCSNATFEKLEVLQNSGGEKMAWVTFTAHIHIDNKNATFTERSRFEKVNDRWLYLEGQTVDDLL